MSWKKPGYRWRILAHEKETASAKPDHTGVRLDIRSRWPSTLATDARVLEGNWEFDELVVDNWLHVEQMDFRHWWLGVGNGDDFFHINVFVDAKGQAHVRIERQ